ncbi:MAG TPA: TetR/AcrR family transcriptional regulator [Paracoccaceae bacterium]|nr:TetR/AcrR family transcriptional regulator [Paracoccaceae bacterium]
MRRAILDCAASMAMNQGLTGLTIQAVADAAGVTKGGLFHHFPSKQALIEGLFRDLLERLDAEIDGYLAEDPEPRGSFTRAYIRTAFSAEYASSDSPWAALCLSLITEPQLRGLWLQWLLDRLTRHHDTEGGVGFEIARLAADGIWLAQILGFHGALQTDPKQLQERLMALTRGTSAA